MNDDPIQLGSMLFTLVDPTVGHEVAFNRWYERDHFYSVCLCGPGLLAGRRWVATRELKDLRICTDDGVGFGGSIDKGSFLATYWVHKGQHDEHFVWEAAQVAELYPKGRGFDERSHVYTIQARSPWAQYRDRDPVPIELSLDHRYNGLVTVIVDRAGGDDDELHRRLREQAGEHLLCEGSPIATAVSWKPIQPVQSGTGASMPLGAPSGGDERTVQMFFVDTDPRDCWDRVRAYVAAITTPSTGSSATTVALAAPFVPTVVGTDTYTDELW